MGLRRYGNGPQRPLKTRRRAVSSRIFAMSRNVVPRNVVTFVHLIRAIPIATSVVQLIRERDFFELYVKKSTEKYVFGIEKHLRP